LSTNGLQMNGYAKADHKQKSQERERSNDRNT
jgi:hypothetical protein